MIFVDTFLSNDVFRFDPIKGFLWVRLYPMIFVDTVLYKDFVDTVQ